MTERRDEVSTFLEMLSANIHKEHERQSKKLIELGFHHTLGLTEREYKKNLPRPTLLSSEDLEQQVTTYLLVDPRVSLQDQILLGGMTDSIGAASETQNLTPIPDKPYASFVKFLEGDIPSVSGLLLAHASENTVHSSLLEVVSVFLHYVDKLPDGFALYAPGSRLSVIGSSRDKVPGLRKGQPSSASKIDPNVSRYNLSVLVRGKHIQVTS